MISTFELYLQFLFDDHTSLTLDLELQNYDLEMLLQLPSLILYIKVMHGQVTIIRCS